MRGNVKKLAILTISIILMLIFTTTVHASSLTLATTTDKTSYTVGETVTVTVNWTEAMQAADFSLQYDSSKLGYVSSSIASTYINSGTAGVIKVAWFSSDDTDKTNITFSFTAQTEGSANFSLVIDGGFSTGNMEIPESYDITTSGTKTVTITAVVVEDEDDNIVIDENNIVAEDDNVVAENDNVLVGNNIVPNQIENKLVTDKTQAAGSLPYTGINYVAIILLALIIISGIIGWKKIKNYKGI